jgi:long-chain acyl-CoA synthetase
MNLLYCLRHAEKLHPHRIAVLDGGIRQTYSEFGQRSRQGASFLLSRLDRGDRVAALLLNRPEYLELYFACHFAGLPIVPLNIRWGVEDFVFALNDSETRAIVLDERFSPLAPVLRQRCPSIQHYIFAGDGDVPDGMIALQPSIEAAAPLTDGPEPGRDDLAGLFYTSGTTGGPKAAMLTHGNLYANALSMMIDAVPAIDVYLHAAPMFHLADIANLYQTTMRGTTHTFLRAFEPEGFMRLTQQYKVNSSVLVPTMINLLVNHPKFDQYDLSSLRLVLYGASPMPLPLLRQTMSRLPQCEFMQGYGMTEMSPIITLLSQADHRAEWPEGRFHPLQSAGKPAMGVEVRVVDDRDHDVPTGEVGEIIARGASRMLGYWKRDEVNAEVLRGGWMHTGDMGAFDERGFLYVMDRKKDMIKTGGENVYSPEVESMIMSHPEVQETAVIGLPDPKWGESIRAIVVRRPGAELSEDELIDYCRQRMTHFKCPSSIVFADALPKGGTGKVQKNVLRDSFGRR